MFLGLLLQVTTLIFAKRTLELGDVNASIILASIALGVGVGSSLVGEVSGKKVELGIIPIACILCSFFCFLLQFAGTSFYLSLCLLFFVGTSYGAIVVPLNTYIQQRSPKKYCGGVIATSNFVSSLAMIGSCLCFWSFFDIFEFKATDIFRFFSILNIIIVSIVLWKVPSLKTRSLNFIRSAKT